ncbi:unnamed protein product [Acanthoscelides obtectus]|uniref:HTH psq-type domain-containing protein n=2 Tax=Acanthoscelides obtectus TaxID=200917 RepID=A0A9P0PQD4_ACAOB|nr:unnamed protein product [Acanthoscelides obtectus]CAK1663521.1 Tetratricopeptide repeat protein 37 [Acanthoscelides obtectus]
MKDVKALLKEARDAIKNKDYETSLKVSKSILKEDKTNYMALIFLGLSLQEVGPEDQAPKAFKKAIELNSTNPLAYNGLISYYEKIDNEDAKKELVKLYTEILELEIEQKKVIEFCEKLASIGQNNSDIYDIAKTVYNAKDKVEDKATINRVVVNLLSSKVTDLPSEILQIYEECLYCLVSNDNTVTSTQYSAYLSVLYKQNRYKDLLEHAQVMHKLFENDNMPLVWICKISNQSYLENKEFAQNCAELTKISCEELLKNDPNDAIGLFTHGIMLVEDQKLLEAKEVLTKVTRMRPGLLHAWIMLTTLLVRLGLYEEAIHASEASEKLLKSIKYSNKKLKEILDCSLIQLYSISSDKEDWQKAIELYNKITNESTKNEYSKYAILAYIHLGKFAEAKSQIQTLTDDSLIQFLKAKMYIQEKRYNDALSLLEKNTPEDSDWWNEIGQIYWKMGEHKNSLVPFLKAAKCDPNNYLTFFYLGNYYQKANDTEKARRCYEKAFKISPNSLDVVTELSSVYRQLKKFDTAQSLLKSLTTGPITKKNCWAYLQLGLSYLEQEDYENAIDRLRYVVRIDGDNVHYWEALADAYFARGSYTSALKCYQRSLEITPKALYPSLQIANIKKILGQYPEAIEDFEELLLDNGLYIPALKGLAETYIRQATECYKTQRFGTSRDHIQSAVNNLTLAMKQDGTYSCLWKLLGDSCTFVTKLSEKYCCLFMANFLLEGGDQDENQLCEKEQLFVSATRFYCKAINLTETNILIWHDLATCYMTHALNTTESEKKKLLLSYAMSACQHCTSINPMNWQHWNLMGNIAMHQEPPNLSLAQHAFIKALIADHNYAVAWANLGTLYFIMDDIKLANKAFAQGQRSDPSHVQSWIGQALIAESLGHEEAMDLFRHCTQIAHHQQSSIGYGHWVCQTLLDSDPHEVIYAIHNMHAIPVACDALTYYTENNPQDSCAWNMLGILKERMQLKQGTLDAFKKAYQLSSQQTRDKARVNYGRMLYKVEDYARAISMFREVEEANFKSGVGLALAYFKDKQYEESYNAYEQALHWLTEEQRNQSELLVALASMAYMFQDANAAKTLLFQSMAKKYKRKTNRGEWSEENMKKTVEAVVEGKMGYMLAAKTFSVPQNTVERKVKEARENSALSSSKSIKVSLALSNLCFHRRRRERAL